MKETVASVISYDPWGGMRDQTGICEHAPAREESLFCWKDYPRSYCVPGCILTSASKPEIGTILLGTQGAPLSDALHRRGITGKVREASIVAIGDSRCLAHHGRCACRCHVRRSVSASATRSIPKRRYLDKRILPLLATLTLAVGGVVGAEEQGVTHMLPRPDGDTESKAHTGDTMTLPALQAEVPTVERSYPQFEYKGWLDQALTYSQEDGNPTYGLFEAALRMNYSINRNFGGHLQLNGRWRQFVATDGTDEDTGNRSEGSGTLSLRAREAYAYAQNDTGSMRLSIGKWYAPIGYELADPPDLFQYSNSNIFLYFFPTEMIGALGQFTFSDSTDLKMYVSAAPTDDDSAMARRLGTPTVGDRLGIALGRVGRLGLSALLTNKGRGHEGDRPLKFDIDGSFSSGESLSLGFDIATAIDLHADATDVGLMIMGNYKITSSVATTLRYDIIVVNSNASGMSITVAPTYTLTPGLTVCLEGRYDIVSDASLANITKYLKDTNNLTGALELIYQFGNL